MEQRPNPIVFMQNGDKDALSRLFQDSYNVLYRYMLKLTLNEEIAKEVCQEAMYRGYQKIELYDYKKSAFSSWLITIAKRVYFDMIKHQKVEEKYASNLILENFVEDPYKISDETKDVLKSLSTLDEKMRTCIVLKHYYGYSEKEISKSMNIPKGTVKSRIHNGIKKLREAFVYG